jgi:O-antigen/teichoic acid export membrane protein
MQTIVKTKLDQVERYLRTDVRYLIKGGGWLIIGQGISTGSAFVSAILFANLLPKEAYGTYKYVLSIFSYLAIPTLPGIAHAVVQNSARNIPGTYQSGLRAKLKWGVFGALASLVLSVYYFMNANTLLGTTFLICAPLIPLTEAFSLWGSYLAGKKLFGVATRRSSIIQICTTILLCLFLVFTDNVALLVLASMFGYFLFRYFVHRNLEKKYADMSVNDSGGDTVPYGAKMTLFSIPGIILGQLDTLLLWKLAGPVALAAYAFSIATTNPAKTMMKSLIELAQPKFAEQDSSILKRTISRKVKFLFLVFIPLTIAYIVILPYLYKIFFLKYFDTVIYAQVFGLIFLFFPLKLYSIAVITRQHRTPTYIVNTILPVTQALLFVVLIPLWGIWGAIYSILIQYVVSSAITYYFFVKMK